MFELVFWIILSVIMAIVEALTISLVSIWFCFGGIGAIIAYYCGAPLIVQVIVFCVVSLLSFLALRPFFRKQLRKKVSPTNCDAVLGQTGIVTERIDNLAQTGEVKLNGLRWSARSESNSPIEADATVRVQQISGVKLIVVPAEAADAPAK